VRAGKARYALRLFGEGVSSDEIDWEVRVINALAEAGVPVPRPIRAPLDLAGRTWLLSPWLAGRVLGPGSVADRDYERLGAWLADFRTIVATLLPPPQRPGWTSFVNGAFPRLGGAARRDALLAALAKTDAAASAAIAEASTSLEARSLPALFGQAPLGVVHGDFAPWNVRRMRNQPTAVLDFDLAHLDVEAVDVAMARRGYHDGVVRGYLKKRALSDAELENLDALWLGGVLSSVWALLERSSAEGVRIAPGALDWNLKQLGKVRPYC